MLQHCCVTGCKGNYPASINCPYEKVSVFKFPTNPKVIHLDSSNTTESLTPSNITVVCEEHFIPSFVVCVDTIRRVDGSVLNAERIRPKLTPDLTHMII